MENKNLKETLFKCLSVARRYWIVFAVIFGGIIADQVTKGWVFAALGRGSSVTVIPSFFHITTAENAGAAFSILEGQTWFFILSATLATIGFVFFMFFHKEKKPIFLVSLSMIISGTIGNLIDRIFNNGLVRDFFHVEYFGLTLFGKTDFPIFNVADMLLVFGTIIFCVYYIFMYKPPEKEESEPSEPTEKWTSAEQDEVM